MDCEWHNKGYCGFVSDNGVYDMGEDFEIVTSQDRLCLVVDGSSLHSLHVW